MNSTDGSDGVVRMTGRPSAPAVALILSVCVVVVAAAFLAGVLPVGIVVAVLLAGSLLLRTSVTLTSEAIDVRMAPLFRSRIPGDEVMALRARTVAPLREFGGWGLRKKRRTTALLLGPKAIELQLRDGHSLVVSISGEDWPKATALTSSGP